MASPKTENIPCQRVELDGIPYVILREAVFEALCRRAGVRRPRDVGREETYSAGLDFDRTTLAEKITRRRRAAGLSQAALARRAGIRPETLNRIERGRTTPDFATIRKLVIAVNAAERDQSKRTLSSTRRKETRHARKK